MKDNPEYPESYVAFYLRAHSKTREYKRSVDNIMDFLGDAGGILEIVFAIGFFVTAPFA